MERILIVSPYFAPSTLVGAARMTSLAGYLAENDCSVTVVSNETDEKSANGSRACPDGIRHIEAKGISDPIRAIKDELIRLLEKEKFDICILSMGPFETVLFVPHLCKKHSLPLILDYRDAWLFYAPYYAEKSILIKTKMFIKDTMMLPFEYKSVSYSAKVVNVTDGLTEVLSKRYRKCSDKMVTIYNGHENLEKYLSSDKTYKKSKYCIGCIGKFVYYSKAAVIELLRAVNELRGLGYDVSIVHAGEESDNASPILEEYGFDSRCYDYLGQMNYDNAMYLLNSVDAALIIYGHTYGLGTKVFDYIGMDKPIIYSGVLPSELSSFISAFQNVVIGNTKKSLADGIKKFIDDNVTSLGTEKAQKYSRIEQNRKYLDMIRGLIT